MLMRFTHAECISVEETIRRIKDLKKLPPKPPNCFDGSKKKNNKKLSRWTFLSIFFV